MKISPISLLRLMCGVLVLSLTFGCTGENASFLETVLVSIEVSPANPDIAFGTDMQFTATGTYSDNTSQDLTASVFWNSSSTAVATISNAANSNGLASAIATGSTLITATLSGVSGSTTLKVSPVTLESIVVTPANPSVIAGTTRQFTATGNYSDGTTAELTQSTNLTWSSSDTAIATISNGPPKSKKGLATGVKAGTVTIKAQMISSVSGTTMLTVVN